jgi:hypothetical protein
MRTILAAFNTENLDVGTVTPVRLVGVAASRPTSPRLSLVITAAGDLFVGGANVTAANGKALAAGGEMAFDSVDGLYAIATTPTTVHVFEAF